MTVIVTWSSTNGGSSLNNDLDHGGAGNNAETPVETIYLRHNGNNSITDCKLLISSINERYDGDFTAVGDLEEVIGWGDAAVAASFGGLFLNLNATGGFPAASWPTFAVKSVTSGVKVVGAVCRTGVGDLASTGLSLITEMGCTIDGELQSGTAPNVRFQSKFFFPQDEDTEGERHIKQVLAYDYTS